MARYDDGKRGFGVTDALGLSDALRQLQSMIAHGTLQFPKRPPSPKMMVFFRAIYPPDRLDDALHSQMQQEDSERILIEAVVSGALPLWIAPADGAIAERPVAPNGLIEFGRESLIAGCYRPPNDTENLVYGYPLFVKRRDWASFLEGLGAADQKIELSSVGATDNAKLDAAGRTVEFDEARPDWLELWQGPIQFRATYDKGKYGQGHTLERINQYGSDGATGRGHHKAIYSVRIDPDDGAIVIEWLVGLPGLCPPFQTERYYHASLGRGFHERLRDDPAFRDRRLAHLPAAQRARAVGAYAHAISIREWVNREFLQALDAGQCEIWARVGSKVAPFRRIPADIFKAYEIKSWGHGNPGGARAELAGSEPLYSIRVAASAAYKAQSDARKAGDRMTYLDAVQWCREWISAGRGNGMDKAWLAFKELPNASGCARDTFFRPAWIEAKTKNSAKPE